MYFQLNPSFYQFTNLPTSIYRFIQSKQQSSILGTFGSLVFLLCLVFNQPAQATLGVSCADLLLPSTEALHPEGGGDGGDGEDGEDGGDGGDKVLSTLSETFSSSTPESGDEFEDNDSDCEPSYYISQNSSVSVNGKQETVVQQQSPIPLKPPTEQESFPLPELESGEDFDSDQLLGGDDPELGNLRLRELERPPAPSKPAVYLLGGIDYLRSDNIFSGVDPVDDGLLRIGLTLLAVPSLGPNTSLVAAAGGNVIRYGEESQFDYDELRLALGIRQQFTPKMYGELGWSNRQLFEEDDGDRFLNDHSLYLELGRQDTLAKKLTLDTFYQLRLSFADPDSRSQTINSLGTSLNYDFSPSLKGALGYQFAFANFTEQDREDEYHQIISRLTYSLSDHSRVNLFAGYSFGDSTDANIDFDGFIFGVGVDASLTLF
ncbi:MAG: hypothetical protein WA919_27470 [Coleofasciculaceae cyanobacterium]